MTNNTDPVRALIGEMTEYLDQQVDPELDVIAKWRDRLEADLASAPQPSFDRRFADMLIGILGDVQDELGFTDEEKLCANGSAEIVAAIRELKERAASQQPAAPSGEAVAGVEPLLESLIQAAFDDGGNEREEFSERVKAARASVVAYVQRLDAAQQQPAAGEEIMVNAAHDVYTLPLQPSGLLSGPRFVVHVPGPRQPAAVDGRIAIEPGERLFQFDSKQEWINHASRIWRLHGVRSEDTVCVDALGRLVNIGKHFADAERDRAYPIVVYRLRADMNRNTGAAQQQGGA